MCFDNNRNKVFYQKLNFWSDDVWRDQELQCHVGKQRWRRFAFTRYSQFKRKKCIMGMTFKSFKMFPISQSVNSPQAHPSRSHSWKTGPPVMGTSLSLGTTRDCINTTEMFGKKKIKFRFVFLSWGFSYCPDVTHTAARGGGESSSCMKKLLNPHLLFETEKQQQITAKYQKRLDSRRSQIDHSVRLGRGTRDQREKTTTLF